MAKVADNIIRAVSDDRELMLRRRSWTIPILTVTGTPQRSSAIKSDLFSITDCALSNSLGQLEELQWLQREIDMVGRSPRSTYQAANIGFHICMGVDG